MIGKNFAFTEKNIRYSPPERIDDNCHISYNKRKNRRLLRLWGKGEAARGDTEDMDEDTRIFFQNYTGQLLSRARIYLERLQSGGGPECGDKAEELLYEAVLCGTREQKREAAHRLGTLYRDFFPGPPDRKRAMYFFYQSYLWGGGQFPERI